MKKSTVHHIKRHSKRLFGHIHSMRIKVSILIMLACLVVVGVVVAHATTPTNAHNRAVVLLMGDSNVTRSATPIDWTLTWQQHNDNAYVPIFVARVGSVIRTPDCLDTNGCTTTDFWKTKLADTFAKINPDVVVNDLGINDTTVPGTETTQGYANYSKKIDWLMGQIPRTKPVFWTNLPCAIEIPSLATGCQTVNFSLALAPKRWPNLTVLNWANEANSHPEYMSYPGHDVHLSPAGQQAWTNFVLSALDARFPVPN